MQSRAADEPGSNHIAEEGPTSRTGNHTKPAMARSSSCGRPVVQCTWHGWHSCSKAFLLFVLCEFLCRIRTQARVRAISAET